MCFSRAYKSKENHEITENITQNSFVLIRNCVIYREELISYLIRIYTNPNWTQDAPKQDSASTAFLCIQKRKKWLEIIVSTRGKSKTSSGKISNIMRAPDNAASTDFSETLPTCSARKLRHFVQSAGCEDQCTKMFIELQGCRAILVVLLIRTSLSIALFRCKLIRLSSCYPEWLAAWGQNG
jgi:hypothetical protein